MIRLNSQLWQISCFFSTHFFLRRLHNTTTLLLFVASSLGAYTYPSFLLFLLRSNVFSVFNHCSAPSSHLFLLFSSSTSRDTPPIPHRGVLCAIRLRDFPLQTSTDLRRKVIAGTEILPTLPRVFLLCACDDHDHDDDHEPALNLFTNAARSRRKFHTLSSSSSFNIPLCRVLNCGALMTTMTLRRRSSEPTKAK